MRTADIYRQYEILRETLLFLSASPRNQAHQIGNWLEECSRAESPVPYRSYVRDLLSTLFAKVPDIAPMASPPSFFLRLRDRIAWAQSAYPHILPAEEFQSCIELLSLDAWTINAYLGTPEAGHPEAAAFTAGVDPGSTEREVLQQWIRFAEHRSIPDLPPAAVCAAEWDRLLRPETGAVTIPVIEEDLSGGAIPDFQPFVTFTRLRLHRRELPAEATEDLVEFSRQPGLPNGQIGMELAACVSAVRRIAPAYIHPYSASPLGLTLSFADAGIPALGRSLGLGFAVGMISLLSHISRDKKYYLGNGTALFSGKVGPDGIVLPIADEQAVLKARAAIYSPFGQMVCPKPNEAAVEDTVAREAPEGRTLAPVAVRDLADAMEHRRAVLIRSLTLRQRAAKSLRMHQSRIALISSALVLILLGGSFLLVDFDREPAEVRLENNYFHIHNRNGKLLWRQMYGTAERPAVFHRPLSEDDKRELRTRSAIYDIDRDGHAEVLLLRAPLNIADVTDRLYCYNRDGSLRWSVRLGKPIRTTEGDYTHEPFSVDQLLIGRFDSLSPPVIVSVTKNSYYSNFLNLVSAEGKILGEYLHIGSIHEIRILPGKAGEGRILFSGTNNALHAAVIGLLDPARMEGVSDQGTTHTLLSPRLPRAREIAYILFPKSDVALAMRNMENPAAEIWAVTDTSIMVTSQEAVMPQEYYKSIVATVTLNYVFSRDLTPRLVNTSTYFDVLHRTLRASGKIESELNDAYKKSLLAGFLRREEAHYTPMTPGPESPH